MLTLFNEFFGQAEYNLTNIYEETDGTQVLEIVLPGYSKEDLEIKVDKDCLRISGQPTRNEENRRYIRQEFRPRKINMAFGIPDNLDSDKIKAKMENGVLVIKVPKKTGCDKSSLISIE